jgi:hypothetical protein
MTRRAKMSEEKVGNESKINFGDYAILDPLEYRFKKAPDLYWKILPVTSGHELQRSRFMMYNRIFEDPSGNRTEQPPTPIEIAHREVALLYGGTNMVTTEGNPVLPEKPSIREIEALLEKMPSAMVMEIWIAIGQSFPKWGPVDPNAWMEEEKE